HDRLEKGALHTERRHIFVGRIELPEAPRRRPVAEGLIHMKGNLVLRREREAKTIQRNGEAQTSRLDVGLLQGPIVEKSIRLPLEGKRAQISYLRGREVALCDLERRGPPAAVFDVHANRGASAYADQNQAFRVRYVEAEPCCFCFVIEDMRLSTGVRCKHP